MRSRLAVAPTLVVEAQLLLLLALSPPGLLSLGHLLGTRSIARCLVCVNVRFVDCKVTRLDLVNQASVRRQRLGIGALIR